MLCWEITPKDLPLAGWTTEVTGILLPRSLQRREEVKHGSDLKGFRLILYSKLNSPIKQPGLDIHGT